MNGDFLKKVCFLFFVCICLSWGEELCAKDFTVVIDAGHGGNDAGAVGLIAKEKDINLRIALELGRLVSNNVSGVKVVYTRKSDVFVPLMQRANITNRANADLFISIHTNSVERKNWSRSPMGAETYTLGLARSEANLAVAKRENAVILMESDYKTRYAGFNPNSSESYIIFEFMQDKHMEQSVHIASLIQKQLKSHCGRADKGVKQAGFLVLRETSSPSVLVEVGFISHKEEERYLNTAAGCKKIAEGIYRAFRQYKKEHDARAGNPGATPLRNTGAKSGTSVAEKEASRPVLKSSGQSGSAGSASVQAVSDADEILFKVQILASGARIKAGSAQFKGLSPVEYYQEGNYYKYTYGSSSDYNVVNRKKKDISSKFATAFVVAFRNGEKMDVNEAIRIFKSRKNK